MVCCVLQWAGLDSGPVEVVVVAAVVEEVVAVFDYLETVVVEVDLSGDPDRVLVFPVLLGLQCEVSKDVEWHEL